MGNQNKISRNGSKTKEKWITIKDIERIHKVKLLGVYCQENLKWNSQVKEITERQTRGSSICASVGIEGKTPG